MSKRQREAHAAKEAERRRWFPGMPVDQVQLRYALVHDTAHIITDFIAAGIGQGLVPEEQQHMFGAHYTIGQYVLNRMTDILTRELELAEKENNLIAVTRPVGLVGPDGKPLANA